MNSDDTNLQIQMPYYVTMFCNYCKLIIYYKSKLRRQYSTINFKHLK